MNLKLGDKVKVDSFYLENGSEITSEDYGIVTKDWHYDKNYFDTAMYEDKVIEITFYSKDGEYLGKDKFGDEEVELFQKAKRRISMRKLAVNQEHDLFGDEQISKRELLEELRNRAAEEGDAISKYDEMVAKLPSGKAREVMDHISKEEKMHLGEITELLNMYDKEQQSQSEEAIKDVKEARFVLKELVKLANHLDKKGLHKEANYLDKIIKKAFLKVSYVCHVKGHKNSKGESAPWVIKSHENGKILSSHKSKPEAVKHLRDMKGHSK